MKTHYVQSCDYCWVFQIAGILSAAFSQHYLLGFEIAPPAMAHLTLHLRLTDSRWVITPLWLPQSLRPFLDSSVMFAPLFHLSASVRSWNFLSFVELTLAWNIPSVCLIFLNRSLVFPILLFSFISLHCSFKKVFLFLYAVLWDSVFSWVYLFLSPLPFSAICIASSDNQFSFFHFFCFRMVLITASCAMLWTSTHSSSGTLSTESNPLNLFITSSI